MSYRQLHVLDETHVMNACKEDCCFVSLDFEGDMRTAQLRRNKVGKKKNQKKENKLRLNLCLFLYGLLTPFFYISENLDWTFFIISAFQHNTVARF